LTEVPNRREQGNDVSTISILLPVLGMTEVNVGLSPPLYHNVGRWGTISSQNAWRLAFLTPVNECV